MEQTLEELRAENATEQAPAAAVPQTVVEEEETDAAGDQSEVDDQAGDQDDEGGKQADPEDWMKSDDQESQGAGKKFTDGDIGAAKAKLRAKLEKQHQSELDELRAQLEAQRNQSVPQPSARPKREDFYEHDDPDEAYTEALMEWKLDSAVAQKTASNQQYEQKRKHLEAQQKISSNVEQHYERAAVLAAASGISPELYQSADRKVREAIQSVFGGESGEHVTNALIANLGEGSEKVMYKLGVSPKSLSELVSKLREDPNGIPAAMYLGSLNSELNTATRKRSNTPAPAANVQGDANTTDLGKGFHRKYLEARKSGDAQKAFSIRREARSKNINVDSW